MTSSQMDTASPNVKIMCPERSSEVHCGPELSSPELTRGGHKPTCGKKGLIHICVYPLLRPSGYIYPVKHSSTEVQGKRMWL